MSVKMTSQRRLSAQMATSLGVKGLALLALVLTAGLTGGTAVRAQDAAQPPSAPQFDNRPTIQEAPAAPSPATSPAPSAPAVPPAMPSDSTAPQAAPSTPPEPTADNPNPGSGVETTPPDAGAVGGAPAPSGEAEQGAEAGEANGPVAAAEGALPHDLSPWGMFMAADIVVKAVMIGLAIASVVTWTIWFAKSIELWIARRQLHWAIRRIGRASSLVEVANDLSSIKGAAGELVSEAAEEVARSLELIGQLEGNGVQERVTSRLSRVEAAANRRMMFSTGTLATIGSTAPFVGLFGTVWGIMNSFIGISQSQTTNLAVVAPGIAEALLATGLGLVAAIPAVIIYNSFANRIAGYRMLLADASAGVERLVSLDLDLRRLPRGARGLRAGSAAE